jgi:dTDP-4-dehydrorhamnose reductase
MPGCHLIVGGDGLIGRALFAQLGASGHKALATTRRATVNGVRLDLAKAAEAKLPDDVEVAYLLASMTNMAALEADPALSRAINVTGTLVLARRLKAQGAHLVFVSTNLVFDGRQAFAAVDSPVGPQNLYAVQKAAVEKELLAAGARVLRLSKVAETLLPLVRQWATDLKAGKPIHPFSDRRCAPVALARVVAALAYLGGRRAGGLHQLGGARDLAYEEIARLLARFMDVPQDLVAARPAPGVQAAHTTMKMDEELAALSPEPSVEAELEPVFAAALSA